ncbi:MAG: NAD(P)H-dependent oxidoreductase [Rudaea sp.]
MPDIEPNSTPPKRKVAVLVGSLRKGSFNKMAARVLIDVAPPHLEFEILDLGGLQLYNQDMEENPPEPWLTFREKIRASDAVLFVSPEYNRSMPATIKNAIDVASRPYVKNAWKGKPGAVMTVSVSSFGGMGSNHHIRQSLVAIDVACMPQPEAYIAHADKLFSEDGRLKDDTREFFRKFMNAFAAWIESRIPAR